MTSNAPKDDRLQTADKSDIHGSPAAKAIAIALSLFYLFAIAVEYPLYTAYVEASDVQFCFRTPYTNWFLTLLLLAKSLALLLPGGVVAVLLLRVGKRRTAYGVFLASMTAILCYQWADAKVFFATGNHITDFALLSLSNNTGQYASRYRELLVPAGLRLAFVAVAALSTCVLLGFVGRAVPPRLARPWCESWVPQGLYLAILFGGMLAPAWMLTPHVRSQLCSVMPFAVPWGLIGNQDSTLTLRKLAGREIDQLRDAYERVLPLIESPTPSSLPAKEALRRPHFVMVVLESWRADALTAEITPRLWQLSNRGTRANRHFSSTNCTQFALFSLLYGRWPINYDQVLDRRIPPLLPPALAAVGYESTFLTSVDCRSWRRIGDFACEGVFDRVEQFTSGGMTDRDRMLVEEMRRTIASAQRPQFVVLHLNSTHFSYSFPPSHARFQPYAEHIDPFNPAYSNAFSEEFVQERDRLFNRYKNAVHYLDDILGEAIEDVLRQETVLVVTGDHGESMHDDGAYGHPSRMSDAQTRVPFFMIGANIEPDQIDETTSHVDVVPTILSHVRGEFVTPAGVHGRSIFDPRRPSEILLTQGGFDLFRYDPWCDVLLVDGARRIRFQFHRHEPSVRVIGLTDEQARPRLPSETKQDELQEALRGAIRFLPRLTDGQ